MLLRTDPLTGSDYWRPIWQGKAGNVAALSGRSSYQPEHVDALIADAEAWLRLEPSGSLLDIGCAAGLMGATLHKRVSRYVGLDYNATALGVFSRQYPDVELVLGSATSLPFKDGEFSKTLMSSVLLCLSPMECFDALREMRRVTRVVHCQQNKILPCRE